jgi:hypothetical protein
LRHVVTVIVAERVFFRADFDWDHFFNFCAWVELIPFVAAVNWFIWWQFLIVIFALSNFGGSCLLNYKLVTLFFLLLSGLHHEFKLFLLELF